MKYKKIIFISCVLIGLMITIFCFSNETGAQSTSTSNTVKLVLEQNQLFRYIFTILPIRKIAHFTIYFFLGIVSYVLCSLLKIQYRGLSSGLFCFLYACSDEFHQRFVPGRGAQLKDVLIDFSGSLLAIIICIVIIKSVKTIKNGNARRKGRSRRRKY